MNINNNTQNNKITVLSEFIANQIAAGEVVQRPESVVKELVENSLDANASIISIIINDAGKSLIHIIDDGVGMSKKDLLLAPLRHSTSKIKSFDDLSEIKTFGFRGEALPSISSVALLEIRTKQKEAELGWKLFSEPMKEFELESIAMENGTQIFVKNLFYNVPARRKFLKSNTTEQKYIYETVNKFALAHPDKRFIFYDNNSLIYDLKAEDLEHRIISALKVANSNDSALLKVDSKFNDIHIWGYVGQPQLARRANPIQYFFLNKRNIISKNLSYAVFSAFEHLIEKNLKPFFVLNIELDYKAVDVNVHPQKSEVKFEDEQLIFSCVKKAVLESLKLNNLVPELVGDSPMNFTSLEEVKFQNENGKEESVIIDKITGEVYDVNRYNNSKFNSLRYNKLVGNSNNNDYHRHNFSNDNYKNSPILNSSLNKLYQPASNELDDTKSNNNIEINTNHYNEDIQNQFQLEIINSDINNNVWQLHNKYIFLQTEDGLLAIDQHNAHERVIYEKLISKINNDISANNIAKQNLLFPITIKINNLQLLAIKEIQNELERIGFSFEISNTDNYNTITIFAQPSDINIGTAENSFLELIDDYLQNEELKHFKKQERICATVACKSAIKAGKKLSQEEMSNIAYELSKCNMPHICPHGRPIIIHSLLTEWDRKFGRI